MYAKRFLLLGAVIFLGSSICAIDPSIITCTEQELLHVGEKENFKDGYPINEYGETYGPDIKDNVLVQPDLCFATNELGLEGYLKKSDLATDENITLEEARNKKKQTYAIPMYKEDGRTFIGWFTIGNRNN